MANYPLSYTTSGDTTPDLVHHSVDDLAHPLGSPIDGRIYSRPSSGEDRMRNGLLQEASLRLTVLGHSAFPPPAAAIPMNGAGLFQGRWDTVTSMSEHFVLKLVSFQLADGPVVSGRFDDQKLHRSGTLQGRLGADGEYLHFDLMGPKLDMVGTGRLALSNDGRAISGYVDVRGANRSATRVEWRGARR
jgi:hypothetical protein